jgi:hypothetical protein
MGTWSAEIFGDDVAMDVRGEFEALIDRRVRPAVAADRVARQFRAEVSDPDDGPVVYLALASLLVDSGISDHPILDRAKSIIERGEGLDRWRDAGIEAFEERLQVYSAFQIMLNSPQCQSEPEKKRRRRSPSFGSVVEIPLPNGKLGYAQYLRNERDGPLIQVFDCQSDTALSVSEVAELRPLWPPILGGILYAVAHDRWKVIGKLPIPDFPPPLFKWGFPDDDGRVHRWFLRSEMADAPLGEVLPEQYKDLEFHVIWGPDSIEERIVTGTNDFLRKLH